MAAASYVSDLASTATSTTNGTIFYCSTAADPTTGSLGALAFGEPTGSIAGATPGFETDYFIKGVATMAKAFNATGVGGFGTSTGSAASVPTDGAVFYWFMFTAPNAINTKVNGGMQMIMGSTSANYYRYYTGGSDTYTYGGWLCFPISPTITSGTGVVAQGTPGAAKQYFGVAANVINAVARGNPLACGGVTFGRGYIDVTNGDLANGYATFDGIATYNDTNTASNYRRLGIFQAVDGGFKYQGLLRLGTTGTAVDFRDSNKSITINNTEFVTTAFNTIEVNNAGSRVDWTGITISKLGTVSRGNFTVNADADVNFDTNTFNDMGVFTFLPASAILNTTFRRCDQIVTGGATFTSCIFDKLTNASAVTATSPANAAKITKSAFISDGTGHGLVITGTAANFTITDNTWTGYAASDGSTGNEAIYVNIASGSMTITISGGTTPSVRSAGANVTVESGAVNYTVYAKTVDNTDVNDAQVLLKARSNAPSAEYLPVDITVTIANSGTTATVTHTGHGLKTNDKIMIKGASHYQNNGVFTITNTGTNTYTYTMASAPGSNPTGTIKATFVFLYGPTSTGFIQQSRQLSSDQNVDGWVRKRSTPPDYPPPNYKTAPLSGKIDSATLNNDFTALMIQDD